MHNKILFVVRRWNLFSVFVMTKLTLTLTQTESPTLTTLNLALTMRNTTVKTVK